MLKLLLASCAIAILQIAGAAAQSRLYDSSNRHTAKFICGGVPETERHLLHEGHYRTAVSIYNPDFLAATATLQTATMNPDETNPAATPHKKHRIEIGPHGVQLIGCDQLQSIYQADEAGNLPAKPSGYGLLMITSRDKLDVTIVYTTAAKGGAAASAPAPGSAPAAGSAPAGANAPAAKTGGEVTGLAMFQPSRTYVRTCVERAKIDLSNPANWETETTTRPIRHDVRGARGENNLAPGRRWMAYPRAGSKSDYSYFLKYCVCSGFGELKGNVQSEGASVGGLHAGSPEKSSSKVAELWPMQAQGNPRAGNSLNVNAKSARIEKIGDGFIEIKISGAAGSSTISFDAELVLDDGHAGRCER